MKFQGEKLKKIRLEKGISLEEVQKKTKINLNILKAIEGDSITNLEPIYIKGFLKIYCKFLGVDPKDCITDYKNAQSKSEERAETKKEPSETKGFTKQLKTSKFNSSYNWSYFKANIHRISIVFILILVIVLSSVLLFNLGKYISSKRKDYLARKTIAVTTLEKKEKRKEKSTRQVKAVTAAPRPQAQDTTLAIKNTNSGIRLGIRASDNCWVQVKADGRLVFQRVLEKGRFESWQAKDTIVLSLGNAGAVELEVNGQIFSNLGRRGEVRKNIIITKEGLNIGR